MNKTTYLIIMLFSVQSIFCQTEKDYENTIQVITEAYNANDADKLFATFSPNLQSSFTIDKVKSFISENQSTKGSMGSASFLLDDNGSKRYLTEFDNASSILVIQLSADQKVTMLLLEEY